MYHYVALIWSPRNPQACLSAAALSGALEHAAPSWRTAFASAGMRLIAQPVRTDDLREYPLPAGHGVILGRLFPADPSELSAGWEPVVTERAAARYVETSGRQLTEDYWGTYVAFLTSPTEPHSVVLRDPSGKLPCYRLRHEQVDILFADIADLSALPLLPFTPNFRYLAAFLYSSALQIRETALAEVTEILAGECLDIRDSAAHPLPAWDPRPIAAAGYRSPYEQAARELRRVTQACIDAWASVHKRVLHCLSGGLDSSIVLGCLARAPSSPAIVCVNQYAEDAESDERSYARIAAERAGTPLVESRCDSETFTFDARLFALPRNPKPSFSQCARLMQLTAVNHEARLHQADAVWKGQGGDHLFLKASNIPSAADYVAERGIGWGLARAVHDAARYSSQPYASVLRSALSAGRSRGRWQQGRHREDKPHFARLDALPQDLERYVAHPWTLASAGLAPGKQRQIELLADVLNRHRPLARKEFAYEHHPLLSQPIIEQCLRTPTYLHLQGGRHRALAREAFGDCVPLPILRREDKGATTSVTVEGIRRGGAFLCELLLDGWLVRNRMVERAQLAGYLRDGRALDPDRLMPLLACIAAEIWARTWGHGASCA